MRLYLPGLPPRGQHLPEHHPTRTVLTLCLTNSKAKSQTGALEPLLTDVGPQNLVSRAGSMSSVVSSPLQWARGCPLPYLTPPVHAPGSCCLAKWFPVDTGHASAMLGAMSTSLMFQGLFRKMTSFLGDLQPLLYLFKYKNEHICQQHSIQFSSVTQLCPTLCDPMDCSTPGLPVHHQLPEFTQTHVR